MTITPKTTKTKKSLQQHADANVSGSSSEPGNETLDDSQVDEQQEKVMFLGITLDKEQRSFALSVDYAESAVKEAVEIEPGSGREVVIESAIFHLKNVCLDHTTKNSERNILEVEVEGKDGQTERYTIASLCVGKMEMGSLDIQLDATNKATIHLAQGSGPIHITGQQEFIYDLDQVYEAVEDPSATDDSESDEELAEEELKLIKKKGKSSPSQPIKRKKGMENRGKKKLMKREAGDSEEAMSEDEQVDDSGSGEAENEVESPPPKPKRKGKAFPAASTSKQTKAAGTEAKKRQQAGKRGEKKN